MRAAWLGVAIVVATLVALGLQAHVVSRAGFLMGDFRAFYCAARVAAHGADPYHTEPLHTCEAALSKRFFAANPGVTVPAPLPGYAIAALVPLAQLPFGVAAALWAILLCAAWALGVVTLARFAAVPWEITFSAFALALGALSLPFGEVVPIAVGFTCCAAYFAWKARWPAAVICTAVAMVEPHIGLPVALALAIWAPATRLPLVLAAGVLGGLSLLALGRAANLEYFTAVLPAHALSEATRDTQYSLTAVLAAFGIPAAGAVRAGGFWYLVMLVLGIIAGGRLAKRTKNGAFIVCVPPAFAVFGGAFIHITQIAVALPAAVLLLSYVRPQWKALAVVALLLLAVPWGWVVSPALIISPLFPVCYLAWRYWNANVPAVLFAGIIAAALIFGLQELYTIAGLHLTAHVAAPVIDPRLPEASWSAYARHMSNAGVAAWATRIPTWAALLGLVALLGGEAGP